MHGLYAWFDGDLGEGFGYSNAPTLPELVYGRAFFPLERPVAVQPGDHVHTRLAARLFKGSHLFRWDTRISAADGSLRARYAQSTFKAQSTSISELRKAGADYVPALNEDGQVVAAALAAMDGGRSLQAIADTLTARFPDRYRTPTQALDEAAKLSQKYG